MKLKMTVTFDPFTVDATKLQKAVVDCGISTDAIETHPARETKAKDDAPVTVHRAKAAEGRA